MSETVNLTIDGVPVTVAKGTNVLEAARTIGVDISAFCYHPGLSIAACCRQCLVSIQGQPKPQPSCQQIAAEGMVVHTQDEKSVDVRRQMLEFTLVNHPIDCPICDKAGECTLQKLYFDHDNWRSRVDTPKVRKPKVVDLGPHIVLDAERCILCTRCIRVCDEVAHSHQLEMANRGDHEELGCAPGAVLDNPYSINTVDVCPVGALTSKDFRFQLRAWELYMTPSVCTGCATGCNTEIHHRDNRAWRLVPRFNHEVNGHWMCDEGRFTYHELRRDRLAAPVVDGLPASWERALAAAGQRLRGTLGGQRSHVGVVLSPQHTNEDNYALVKLARDIWQLDNIYVGGKPPAPERADDILRDADVNPNSAGVVAVMGTRRAGTQAILERDLCAGELRVLVVLGHGMSLSAEALAAAGKLDLLVVVSAHETDLTRAAHVALPAAAWAEIAGTMSNRQGRVQRLRAAFPSPGQALPAWEIVTRLAQACDATVTMVFGWPDARHVFDEMAAIVPALKNAEWGGDARPVQLRWANSRG